MTESATASPIRVLIADDDQSFAGVLARVVAAGADMEVVGAGRDAGEAIELAASTAPDVALLDVHMPAGGGPRAAREIRERSPRTRLVALSGMGDEEAVLQMLQAGASAYLVKSASAAEIRAAIGAAMRGESPLSSKVSGVVVSALTHRLRRQQEEAGRFEQVRARVLNAIGGERLSVAFQPIVDLANGVVRGVAALPRFEGPPRQPPTCLDASGKVSDIVGRLGGTEFGAVLVGCSRDEGASYFCEALSGRLSEQLRRRELAADVVAGVAPLGEAASPAEALAHAAAKQFRLV